MVTRKTQYGWMAIGGLLCMFGLVLTLKLRDGNRAQAQQASPTATSSEKESLLTPPLAATENTQPQSPRKKAENKEGSHRGLPASEKPFLPGYSETAAPAPRSVPATPPADELKTPSVFSSPSAKLSDMKSGGKQETRTRSAKDAPPPTMSTLKLESTRPPLGTSADMPFSSRTRGSVERDAPSLPSQSESPRQKSAGLSAARGSSLPVTPPAWNTPKESAPQEGRYPGTYAETRQTEPHPLPGEPPLAPTPGPVQMYQARGNETLRDIARRTLGSSDRWADIHKLNPAVTPELSLVAGTTLRLPGDACVQEEEGIRPLPALPSRVAAPKPKKLLPLTGTFPCNLDENKALTLPRSIRDQLGSCSAVLVSPGPDKCLWLTSQAHLDRLAERLERSSAREADVRIFKRLYFAQTEKTEVDAEGRITLSERLAQFALLQQEVVLIGIDDHFEIWDAGRWKQYIQQKSGLGASEASEQE